MVEANMTQEEIDLLLNNVDSLVGDKPSQTKPQATQKNVALSPIERDKIADEFLQGLNKGTTGLGIIFNTDVAIHNPYAEIRQSRDILKELKGKNIIFNVELGGTISGNLYVVIPNIPAKKISNILMGSIEEEATDEPLDAAQLTTIKDTLSSLVYSLISHLSAEIRSTITTIRFQVINGNEFTDTLIEDNYTRIQFNFEVVNYVDSKITLILPNSSSKQFINILQKNQVVTSEGLDSLAKESKESRIPIQEVEFPSISTTSQGLAAPNTDLLLDVQMTITVELGRTKKYIKEILEMGEGSVIELQKQAGEHVDILVNGKLIARGEVVVIDENFGVRVTEIISAKDKLGMRKQQ